VRSLGALAVTEQEVKAIRVPVAVLVGESDPIRRLHVEPLSASGRLARHGRSRRGPSELHPDAEFKEGIKKWLDQQAPPRDSARPHG